MELQAAAPAPSSAVPPARSPAQRRVWRIPFRHALLCALAVAGVHVLILAALPDTAQGRLVARAAVPAEALLAALALYHGARQGASHHLLLYEPWSYLGLALAAYAAGGVAGLAAELAGNPGLLSVLARGFHLAYYPVFAVGILLFPYPRRPTRREWARLGLDICIVLLGVILVAWSFLAGPVLASGRFDSLGAALSTLGQPAADLALLLLLTGLLLRQTWPQKQGPLLLLTAGAGVVAVTRAASVYRFVLAAAPASLPAAPHWLDLGLGAACLLLGLAGIRQAAVRPGQAPEPAMRYRLNAWQLYLPYLSLAVSYALLLWRHGHDSSISFAGLALGIAGLMGLMMARQAVAFADNALLYAELSGEREALEQRVAGRTADLEQTNRDLQEEMQSNARLYVSLQQTNGQLVDAVRSKDVMIQNVSHELRTPLMLILGYVELLNNRELGDLVPEQADALDIVMRQGERLRFMVNRLLTLQTFDANKFCLAPVDVRLWLEQIADAWQVRAAQSGITLAAEVLGSLPALIIDRDFVGQVLENLLDNAVKFTPKGGHVFLRAWPETGHAILAVSDDGAGIPEDCLAQIFDRFYQVDGRTNRRYGGMGIGLALCRAIVEAHGGRIWAESAGEGQGTAFFVELPLECNGPSVLNTKV